MIQLYHCKLKGIYGLCNNACSFEGYESQLYSSQSSYTMIWFVSNWWYVYAYAYIASFWSPACDKVICSYYIVQISSGSILAIVTQLFILQFSINGYVFVVVADISIVTITKLRYCWKVVKLKKDLPAVIQLARCRVVCQSIVQSVKQTKSFENPTHNKISCLWMLCNFGIM